LDASNEQNSLYELCEYFTRNIYVGEDEVKKLKMKNRGFSRTFSKFFEG